MSSEQRSPDHTERLIAGAVHLEGAWPRFGLRIVTPRLGLRAPTDPDMAGLLDAIAHGVRTLERLVESFTTSER